MRKENVFKALYIEQYKSQIKRSNDMYKIKILINSFTIRKDNVSYN